MSDKLSRFPDTYYDRNFPILDEPDEFAECANERCKKIILVGDEYREYCGMICCDDLVCLAAITDAKLLIAGDED